VIEHQAEFLTAANQKRLETRARLSWIFRQLEANCTIESAGVKLLLCDIVARSVDNSVKRHELRENISDYSAL